MAMAEIYEKDRSSLEEYANHFKPLHCQVGAVFMFNGEVAGLDSFGKPDSFSKVFKKLIGSYLDSVDWFDPEKESKAPKTHFTKFMEALNEAQLETRPSVGEGTDSRLESKKVTGFSLMFEEGILHLAVFPKRKGQEQNKYPSRMENYSQRRKIG